MGADEAFVRIAEVEPAFGGLTYKDMGNQGAPLKETASISSGD